MTTLKYILLSLFSLAVLLIVIAVSYLYYPYYYRSHHFVKRQVIENITGIKLPRYEVVERHLCDDFFSNKHYGSRIEHFLECGDKDTFVLEFKELPDNTFYQKLIDNDFDYREGCYGFLLDWGSGLIENETPPKGESGNYQFKMKICEVEKRFVVTVMDM